MGRLRTRGRLQEMVVYFPSSICVGHSVRAQQKRGPSQQHQPSREHPSTAVGAGLRAPAAAATAVDSPASAPRVRTARPVGPLDSGRPGAVGEERAPAPTSDSRTRTCAGDGLAHAHGGGGSGGGSCRGLRAAGGSERSCGAEGLRGSGGGSARGSRLGSCRGGRFSPVQGRGRGGGGGPRPAA